MANFPQYAPQPQRRPANGGDFNQYATQAKMKERFTQPLYDRVNLTTTALAERTFFSVPKGQATTLLTGITSGTKIKTARDTNIETAGINPTKAYKVVGMNIAFVHDTSLITAPADREMVKNGTYLEFKIGDKYLLTLPTFCFPEVNPIVAFGREVTAGTVSCSVTGNANRVFPFQIPITLEPNVSFGITLKVDGTVPIATTMDMYVILWAYMERPV